MTTYDVTYAYALCISGDTEHWIHFASLTGCIAEIQKVTGRRTVTLRPSKTPAGDEWLVWISRGKLIASVTRYEIKP